jgi:hypothetical protein
MQLFVEDYCSRVSEPIQTGMRANQERRWRKVLDDALINLRDHTCRFTRAVITFQQIHLGLVSPSGEHQNQAAKSFGDNARGLHKPAAIISPVLGTVPERLHLKGRYPPRRHRASRNYWIASCMPMGRFQSPLLPEGGMRRIHP